MRRWSKRVGVALAGLGALLTIALLVLYALTGVRMAREYDLPAVALMVPTDSDAVARGRHLATSVALCSDCHGGDLSGKMLIDDRMVGRIMAPNLTPSGRVRGYTDADWVRAIRHGVTRDSRSLAIMPSYLYSNLSDYDLGALIAYLKQVPPVARQDVRRSIGPLGRLAIVGNKLEVLAAEFVDHGAPRLARAPSDDPAEYGRYLTSVGCAGCHGEQMRGKQDDFHDVPDITPQGRLAGWTETEFVAALRTGRRPDDTQLSPEKMPWPLVGQMTDEELAAVYSYLQQLDRRVALQGIER